MPHSNVPDTPLAPTRIVPSVGRSVAVQWVNACAGGIQSIVPVHRNVAHTALVMMIFLFISFLLARFRGSGAPRVKANSLVGAALVLPVSARTRNI